MIPDRLRYFLGCLLMIPVFPLLYVESKKLLRHFPDLPEAKNPNGSCGNGTPLHVLVMGESSIAGVGVSDHRQGIAGQMAKELASISAREVQWQVLAKSGYTAKKVGEKLVDQIPDQSFDLIVLGLGGNDTFQLNKPWTWARHIKDLVEALHLKNPEAQIVITYMPPVHTFTAFSPLMRFFLGGLTKLFGREVKRLSKQLPPLYYFDYVVSIKEWMLKSEEATGPSDFYSDGVHPSALTYRIWGQETARFIFNSVLPAKAN